MYYTYVVRPSDAPEGRGPQFMPFWTAILNWNLRAGFLLQAVGGTMVCIAAIAGGHPFQTFSVLSGETEALRRAPLLLALLGTFVQLAGAVSIQNFRSIADDDASIKQSRGFRAGIKCLHQASLLDILATTFSAILLFSFMSYFEDDWTAKRVGGGSTAIFANAARALHALALILYACSFFFLESFHGEGTAEFWGWLLNIMFKVAGLTELLCLAVGGRSARGRAVLDVLFTLIWSAATLSALLWSTSFEPVVHSSDVKLTQSALRNEIYKSRNAMAYYGPPGAQDAAAPV